MTVERAMRADREGRIEDAALEYEAALTADSTDLETVLNLAILYWQSTDYGFSSSHDLSPQFVRHAGVRCIELLDGSTGVPLVNFWRRYVAWADLGGTLNAEECRVLLRDQPGQLEPATFLFAVSDGREAESEARELLQRLADVGTTRGRYVSSVIQGVLKRRRSKA